jgi:lipopolysaccharide export system ATP-binding protein
MPDTLIAENIFATIGRRRILNGVTIRAERGSITALLGRNGSGKTTMLQSIFGTRSAEDCDVFINGKKVKRPYAINGLLNYLPQKPFLPPSLKIERIMKQFGVQGDEFTELFPELEADIGKRIGELSGGRERLFSVILLLLADTRFTFLDEPFSHIMPLHVDQLRRLLLRQKEKKGIIITDHMYRHLLHVSDQVYLMKEGKSIFVKDKRNLVLHGYLRELDA